jgi:hypothetical protein
MTQRRAVLLIGSPHFEKSTSWSLGSRLLDRLAGRGLAAESHFIHRALESEDKAAAMFRAVESADVLVFAFPLYVDHLPAPVIWACEEIARRRREARGATRPLLATIVQSGFPETYQNRMASDIMRRFADQAGFEWGGGLIMGGGGTVSGRSLPQKPKGMLRNLVLGLERAAADLAGGRPISPETTALVGRKLMAYRLYRLAANLGMRLELRKSKKKTGKKIDAYARPYAAS